MNTLARLKTGELVKVIAYAGPSDNPIRSQMMVDMPNGERKWIRRDDLAKNLHAFQKVVG